MLDPQIRAKRRLKEYQEMDPPVQKTLDQILQEIIARDEADINRKISPLRKSEDAFVFDTSDLTFDRQIDMIEVLVRDAYRRFQESKK